jgi:integrase
MYEAHAYIRWLYEMEKGRRHQLSSEYVILDESVKQLERFQKRFKGVARRTKLGKREALAESVIAILLAAIEVGSASNPWPAPFVQARNLLMILLGLRLGLRIGEILGIKCSDLNLRAGTIIIRRRADDPEDTRSEQPNAKTSDRVLRFGEEVATAIENFIIHHRSKVPGARDHDFLMVAHRTGCPLSPSAAKKSFQVLRSKVPGLPADLVAHILRHCFNDDFSKAADKKRLPEAKEVKVRSYANGWSEHSGSAAIYTRRHVRREANKLSLELQAATIAATHPVP